MNTLTLEEFKKCKDSNSDLKDILWYAKMNFLFNHRKTTAAQQFYYDDFEVIVWFQQYESEFQVIKDFEIIARHGFAISTNNNGIDQIVKA